MDPAPGMEPALVQIGKILGRWAKKMGYNVRFIKENFSCHNNLNENIFRDLNWLFLVEIFCPRGKILSHIRSFGSGEKIGLFF